MFPQILRNQLTANISRLFENDIQLLSESTQISLVNGTPQEVITQTVHWEGKGSIQYERPRIQKSIADEYQGTMEDPVTIVCYLPFDAAPDESMIVVDVDGAASGVPGHKLMQSRKPANVGGNNSYWEVYLGLGVNAQV